MTMLFGLITAVSLVYWLVLMLYTGFSLSQSWIWLFFALAAAVNCAAAAAYRRDTSFLSLRFLTSIHTVALPAWRPCWRPGRSSAPACIRRFP